MTGKRFEVMDYFDSENKPIKAIRDTETTEIYSMDNELEANSTCGLLNTLHEERNYFERKKEEFLSKWSIANTENIQLRQENEQLKATMREVAELLSEEVDLFSDKATEHDINAYIELTQLDNKDAYYMAITMKKAIKMLKGDVE